MDVFVTTDWLTLRTGRHRTTINRWRRQRRLPPEVARLARIELEGRLELVHPAWQDWTVHPQTGVLVTPGGTAFTPGEIMAVQLHQQRVRELERALARLQPDTVSVLQRLVDWLKRPRAGRPRGV